MCENSVNWGPIYIEIDQIIIIFFVMFLCLYTLQKNELGKFSDAHIFNGVYVFQVSIA